MKRWALIGAGILVGYLAAALLSSATTATLRAVFEVARSEHPPLVYELFDLAYSTVLAGVGAWLGSWVARSRVAAYLLAALSFQLIGVSAVLGWDTTHALIYQWAATILTPAAIVIGGMLVPAARLRS